MKIQEGGFLDVTPELAVTGADSASTGAFWMIDVIEAALHGLSQEWLFFRELRIGTGHGRQDLQRLDAFALNCRPYKGMKRICYEVKASRADFVSEMKQPLKRRIGMRFSNEFYFVTPGGMLGLEEVPSDCGLIEIGKADTEESRRLIRRHEGFFHIDSQTGSYCMTTVPAPWRDTTGPTWQFAAAMLRNQQRALVERPLAPPRQLKLDLC